MYNEFSLKLELAKYYVPTYCLAQNTNKYPLSFIQIKLYHISIIHKKLYGCKINTLTK